MMRLHVQIVSHRLKTDIKEVSKKKRRNVMLSARTNSKNLYAINHDVFDMPFWYELKDRGRLY